MREFMLLVRNEKDHQEAWPPDKHEQFLKSCERYIAKLKEEGKLISAQPMVRTGKMISGTKGNWEESNIGNGKEVIVGYYHIKADDIEDAASIAKANPEFEYSTTARVEVRPIKMKEDTTGYIYPTK